MIIMVQTIIIANKINSLNVTNKWSKIYEIGQIYELKKVIPTDPTSF